MFAAVAAPYALFEQKRFAYYLGRRYEREKKAVGRPEEKIRQSDGIKSETAEKIASEHGVKAGEK